MDEEQRRLKSNRKRRTIGRKKLRHAKFRLRDLFGLYRNKRAEVVLTYRPFMYWVRDHRHEDCCLDYYQGP